MSDVEFLLEESARILPGLGLSAEDVISTWAGVRPLTYDEAFPKGNRSRTIHDLGKAGLSGTFAMTAGPLMTYRSTGEELRTAVQKHLTPSATPKEPEWTTLQLDEDNDTSAVSPSGGQTMLAHTREVIRREQAMTLGDILFRRVGIGWRYQCPREELDTVSVIAAQELGWSEDERLSQIDMFLAETERLYGIPPSIARSTSPQ